MSFDFISERLKTYSSFMSDSSQPNIIVFFTDQQRWDTMGLNGNPMGLTPHLDRLARQGTFIKHAVTCQPVCGPARSCLQTGQYATTTGVWKNGNGLKEDAVTLASCFNDAGYRTGYIGKWHLAGDGQPKGPVSPELRGGYQDWLAADVVELTSGPYSTVFWDGDGKEHHFPGYRADAQTDAAIRYIDERAKDPDQPYMLFLSYIEPHHQNTDDSYPAPIGTAQNYRGGWLPPDLQDMKGSSPEHWAGYCGMVKRLDESLGRLMDTLVSRDQADNTIVAFISDHGCHFKTRNGEYKRTPHESSIRVPMALWGPGFNGGGERTEPAGLINLPATLLDGAGIPVPDTMQEGSLLPLTRNETQEWPTESFIQFGDGGLPPGRAIRTNRWKYAVKASDEYKNQGDAEVYQEMCLYDLECDPYELRNLIGLDSHAEIVDDLRNRLLKKIFTVEGLKPKIESAPVKRSGHRMADYPRGKFKND
jgi:arylsulfatase A-like enzyme